MKSIKITMNFKYPKSLSFGLEVISPTKVVSFNVLREIAIQNIAENKKIPLVDFYE